MKLKSIFIRKRRKNESLFKYISAIIHLWLGLVSSVVVMIVCITGCIYAFKNEINNYFNRSHLYVKVEKQALPIRSEENKTELQSRGQLVCRLLLLKKKK